MLFGIRNKTREAEIPFVIPMVPKGGLDRLSLRDLAIGLCGAASEVGALAGSSPSHQ
ncbi:MAG TPA: hypothetical protein VLB09_04730 [Nitrospiria bacterium]|nr:hypothetical protein [Nitrospiria bacterium]